MNHPHDSSTPVCPWTRQVLALVDGQPGPVGREVRSHVATCPSCQAFETNARRVVARLLADPDPSLRRDLIPAVMSHVRAHAPIAASSEARPPRDSRPPGSVLRLDRRSSAVALLSTLLLSALALWPTSGPTRPYASAAAAPNPPVAAALLEARRSGIAWVLHQQAADGSFGGPGTGSPVARTAWALTALATSPDHSPQIRQALDRGASWLLRHQQPSGRFVDPAHPTQAPAVHGIATLALLAIHQRAPWPELRPRCEAAVRAGGGIVDLRAIPPSAGDEVARLASSWCQQILLDSPWSPSVPGETWNSLGVSTPFLQRVLAAQRSDGRLVGSWSDPDRGSTRRLEATAAHLLALARAGTTRAA